MRGITMCMAAMLLAACNVFTPVWETVYPGASVRDVAQAAVHRLIEQSDTITRDDVLRVVDEARAVVDGDASMPVTAVADHIRRSIPWHSMDAPDAVWLLTVISRLEAYIADEASGRELQAVRLRALLAWIEEAAT